MECTLCKERKSADEMVRIHGANNYAADYAVCLVTKLCLQRALEHMTTYQLERMQERALQITGF